MKNDKRKFRRGWSSDADLSFFNSPLVFCHRAEPCYDRVSDAALTEEAEETVLDFEGRLDALTT